MLGQSLPSIATPIPGPSAVRWIEALAKSECPSLTARRARRAESSGASHDPIVWSEARGSNVRDVDGNVFVDLTAGFGVASVGHAHPRVVQAIQDQAGKLIHALGDVHPSEPKIALSERLAGMLGDARVILGQNGSDAIAAALKTAMLSTKRPGVIAFNGGYHGLMYAPLALCGYSEAFRSPFAAQLNPHVRFAPYPGDLAHTLREVDAALDGSIGAIVVEPALGRGGVVFPPHAFLPELEQRCREHGALLIVDEIFTGFGRTGARFAFEPSGARPDIVCVGKALGGGMPISACIGTLEVMRAWGDPGAEAIHTATFAGHPIACAAALATLDAIEDEKLIERADRVGARLAEQLRSIGCAVRGRGLMLGIERSDSLALVRRLLERGYLTLPAGSKAEVLQITPPLTIAEPLLDAFASELE